MKKLLVLAVLFVSLACGNSTEESTTSDTVNVTTETDTINAAGITPDTSLKSDTARRDSF